MKIRLLGCVAALSLLGVACDQPEPDCAAARSPFAARLTKTSGEDDCRLVGPYIGDILGVQTYTPSLGGDPAKPDLDHPFIAINAFTLKAVYHGQASAYGVQDPETDNLDPATRARNFYAIGDFTSVEPADQLCTVPTFRSRAEYISTEFPATTCGGGGAGGAGGGGDTGGAGGGCVEDPGTPGFNITYDWSDVRMIDRSDAVGTAFTAKMSYSETQTVTGADPVSCSATYDVIAIAPAVDCSVYDADGVPTGEGDESLCLPEADPAAGRVAGSGLNPKLRDIIRCVDAGQAVLGFQCALIVNTIEEVREQLESQ